VDAVLCVRAVGSGWAETDGRGKHRIAHRTPDTATGHGTLLHKNCYMYTKKQNSFMKTKKERQEDKRILRVCKATCRNSY